MIYLALSVVFYFYKGIESANDLAENTALEYAGASFVSIAGATVPLFTGIMGFIVLKEKGFGLRFIIGFVGRTPVIIPHESSFPVTFESHS